MKHKKKTRQKKRDVTQHLARLPRKILQLHGRDNIAEFVLHELSNEDCFNLDRIAYVIDNPDFNCLKGIAGYCRPESYSGKTNIWQEPDTFSEHMKKSAFNNKVRHFCTESHFKRGESDKQVVSAIAHELDFTAPSFYAWIMKHDNHGILLYEKSDQTECDCDYLLEGLCLIGFCPVF
jgi:hypothetical protein